MIILYERGIKIVVLISFDFGDYKMLIVFGSIVKGECER